MKIKTSELTGAALDWAVAKAEGILSDLTTQAWGKKLLMYHIAEAEFYCPSANWNQGGPIAEREKISVSWDEGQQEWIAICDKPYACPVQETGPTELVARMRCYVASRLGDEVDIPEELL